MPERGILRFKSAVRLERRSQQPQKEASYRGLACRLHSSATIGADVNRFSHQINTDEVFGTHRRPSWSQCRRCNGSGPCILYAPDEGRWFRGGTGMAAHLTGKPALGS
jgi:hypothetical protein